MAITSQSANSLKEVLFNLQMQLKNRGESSGKRLLRTFLEADSDRNGYLDRAEFESLLNKSGIFLSRQDTNYLMWHFDKNQDGRVSYQEVYEVLVPPLNSRRAQIVKFVYNRLAASGPVSLSTVFSSYKAANHPQVAMGIKSEEEILNKFLDVFEAGRRAPESSVNENDFVKAMREVSAAYPIDDNAFVRMMECVWGVKEQVDCVKQDLGKVETLVKEKIRQRMPSVETEENALKKLFKFVDVDRNGWVNLQEFETALKRIGVLLNESQLMALFEKFDTNGDERLDYNEFSRVVGRNNSRFVS